MVRVLAGLQIDVVAQRVSPNKGHIETYFHEKNHVGGDSNRVRWHFRRGKNSNLVTIKLQNLQGAHVMKDTTPANKNEENRSTIQALRASCIASNVSNEISARAFPASERIYDH